MFMGGESYCKVVFPSKKTQWLRSIAIIKIQAGLGGLREQTIIVKSQQLLAHKHVIFAVYTVHVDIVVDYFQPCLSFPGCFGKPYR